MVGTGPYDALTPMPEDDPIYELGAIVAAIRRRAVLILALTALAVVAAAVVSLSQADRYEATATLLFRAPGLDEQIFDRSTPVGGNDVYDGDTNTGLVALRSVAVRTAEGARRRPSPPPRSTRRSRSARARAPASSR